MSFIFLAAFGMDPANPPVVGVPPVGQLLGRGPEEARGVQGIQEKTQGMQHFNP